jgi:hypothetical protein
LELSDAAQQLKVPKRRIYDITNVLEGIGYLEKKSKNVVQWKANVEQDRAIQEDKLGQALEEEHKLDMWISRLRQSQQEQQTDNARLYVPASAIHACCGGKPSYDGGSSDEDEGQTSLSSPKLAIHAPAGSLIQVSCPEPSERVLLPRHNLLLPLGASITPERHQLCVSSSSGSSHKRIKREPVQVYMLPQNGSPPKPLTDSPMVRLLLPPTYTAVDRTGSSECAVLERGEGVSDFF